MLEQQYMIWAKYKLRVPKRAISVSKQIYQTESLETIVSAANSAAECSGICLHDSISKEALRSIEPCTFFSRFSPPVKFTLAKIETDRKSVA